MKEVSGKVRGTLSGEAIWDRGKSIAPEGRKESFGCLGIAIWFEQRRIDWKISFGDIAMEKLKFEVSLAIDDAMVSETSGKVKQHASGEIRGYTIYSTGLMIVTAALTRRAVGEGVLSSMHDHFLRR